MSLAPPATVLAPGFHLDRYELLWPLAEGGMASVWLARLHGKRGFEKLVAVKTILPKFASDPRFQSMFLDEARIASGIEHTNVARVLDLGEEHGVLYIAMEWVDGDALSKLQRVLARAAVPLPEGIVLRIMADACAGLHAAHELRARDGTALSVVHRDVSPQNILVSAEGVAKIIDFGVAKARDRVSEDTSAGSLKGKISYMAPEQALGKEVDRRVDVWAIGATLYYFFSGRKVYESDTELGTLRLLTSGAPPVPLPPTVSPIIRDIIKGTLRFDPGARTPNLDIVRRQLEDAMTQNGYSVRPEDVGTFIATHAADRSLARRTTVEKALQAADARAALEQERASASSSSGLIGVEARQPNSLLTRSGGSTAADTRFAGRQSGETSSATLGSAALDAAPAPSRRPHLGLWFAGVAALGACATGVAGLIYVLHPSASQTAVGSPPPPVPVAPSSSAAAAPSAGAKGWVPVVAPTVPATGTPGVDAAAPVILDLDSPITTTPAVTKPVTNPATGPRKSGAAKHAAAGKTSNEPDDGF